MNHERELHGAGMAFGCEQEPIEARPSSLPVILVCVSIWLAAAAAVVANAVNDALSPFNVTITEIPLTPKVLLTALGRI